MHGAGEMDTTRNTRLVHLFCIFSLVNEFFVDITDLHKFVSVALHMAAGEDDYSSDRLSRLKIIGSGFKPLIYDLTEGSNLEKFQSCCEAVWKAVEQNPKLTTFLVSCSDLTLLFKP